MSKLLDHNVSVDELPSGWSIGYAHDILEQVDASSCGPLCCYNFLLKVRGLENRVNNKRSSLTDRYDVRKFVVDEYIRMFQKYRQSRRSRISI